MTASVVVLGLSPTAKYLARACFLAGIPCIGIGSNRGSAYYSRYWAQKSVLSETACRTYLESLAQASDPYYVCPTSDEWIAFIASNAKLFTNSNLHTSQGYLDGTYDQLGDKKQLQQVCLSAGIPYPKSVIWTCSPDHMPSIPEDMQYPFFCKPTNRAGLSHLMQGKKGWVVEKEEQLSALLEQSALAGIELIIQEIITGPETNIQVLGTVAGSNAAAWTGIKARQFPAGFGSASLVVQMHLPELEEIADQLIARVGYAGYFALEVKYCDLRKQTYVIEVNPRPGLWFGITTDAGADLLSHWLELLSFPGPVALQSSLLAKRVVWKYLYKDWAARYLQWKKGESPPAINTRGYKNSYAVWDIQDPLPFFMDIWGGVRKWIQRKRA